jgi:hypothetical protein
LLPPRRLVDDRDRVRHGRLHLRLDGDGGAVPPDLVVVVVVVVVAAVVAAAVAVDAG